MFFVEEFHHLKIQLKDLISATDNFDSNKLIGHGGFGLVYKGELSLPEGRRTVAIKRLDRKFGQGNTEFWKEIMMLSKCKHKNLVSLLHFCFEGDEMILVYEYASRGSLDRHLSDTSLTWIQRLKICVGVAHGLKYLHDPKETKQRVLHRDIKSSNILLDENWNAKLSDFGLSKFGPANQPQTYLVSNVVGTFGYCDPSYFETGLLSKESDVYSFGVVLLELMCGRLCCEYRNGELIKILVPMWKKCFDEERLDDIIFHDLKGQVDPKSLVTFSTIAIRCLNRDHKERPTMAEIVKELVGALKQQNGASYGMVKPRVPDHWTAFIKDEWISDATDRRSLTVNDNGTSSTNSFEASSYQNDDDPNNTTIFVGGLDPNVSEEHLRQVFSLYGELVHVKIPVGNGKRCGLVQFAYRICAEEALRMLQGTRFGGQTMTLSWGPTPSIKQ